jgi:deoxyribonuclease IV
MRLAIRIPMNLGVHVSAAGHIYESVDRAHALGCTTMQIFSRNPQQWKPKKIDDADAAEFRRRRQAMRISPVFIHIPYLINLASPEKRLYAASIDAYIKDIIEARKLGADYIVTHMGSRKDSSVESGLRRLSSAVREIIHQTHTADVGILLENTAGSGTSLGASFVHHKAVIDAVGGSSRLGVCLDTAHAHAAGYDLASSRGLGALLTEIDESVGVERLRLVHLNDCRSTLGSHVDRHEHIGQGTIGIPGMRRIVNHRKLKNCAFILETPKDSDRADALNLERVRKIMR